MKLRSALRRSILPATLLSLAATSAHADILLWTGASGDGSWSNGANWFTGNAPTTGDSLQFSDPLGGVITNTSPAVLDLSTITFQSGAGSTTLGGNTIYLTANSAGPSIYNLSTTTQTVSAPLVLSEGLHLITAAASGGGLSLTGTLTLQPGAVLRFASPVNTTISTTLINDSTGILGGSATIAGNWATAAYDGTISAYTGCTTVSGTTGTSQLVSNAASNVRIDSTTAYAPKGGVSSNTFTLTLTAAPTSPASLIGATVTGTGIAAGTTITAVNGKVLTLSNRTTTTSSNQTYTIGIPITVAGVSDIHTLLDSTALARTIAINSDATLRLGNDGGIYRADSSTTNALTIGTAPNVGTLTAGGADNQPGQLVLNANSASQDSPGIIVNAAITDNGTGAVTLVVTGNGGSTNNAGGSVILNAKNSYTGGTFITLGRTTVNDPSALGTGPVIAESGAQLFLNATGTYTNNLTLIGDGIATDATTGVFRIGASVTLAGSVTVNSEARITNPGYTMTLAGGLRGAGTFNLVGTGNATFLLAGQPSTTTGNIVVTATTLQIGTNETLPSGTNAPTLTLNGNATLDLNGHTQTFNTLLTANTSNLITNNSTTPATLKLGAGNTTSTFAGTLQDGTGKLAFTKVGTGTLTLTNATYTGTTTVQAGTLILHNGSNSQQVTIAPGATLQAGGAFSGSVTVDGTFSIDSNTPLQLAGTLTADAGSVLNWTPSTTPAITFTGGTLLGAGLMTLHLDGSLAYDQTHPLFAGTLPANWSFAAITGYDSADYTAQLLHTANGYSLAFVTAAAASVPEPASLALITTCAGFGLLFRRRRV